jgi:hypothetical protein
MAPRWGSGRGEGTLLDFISETVVIFMVKFLLL